MPAVFFWIMARAGLNAGSELFVCHESTPVSICRRRELLRVRRRTRPRHAAWRVHRRRDAAAHRLRGPVQPPAALAASPTSTNVPLAMRTVDTTVRFASIVWIFPLVRRRKRPAGHGCADTTVGSSRTMIAASMVGAGFSRPRAA